MKWESSVFSSYIDATQVLARLIPRESFLFFISSRFLSGTEQRETWSSGVLVGVLAVYSADKSDVLCYVQAYTPKSYLGKCGPLDNAQALTYSIKAIPPVAFSAVSPPSCSFFVQSNPQGGPLWCFATG